MIRYKDFTRLRNYLEDIIFQQDGALSHYFATVWQYLDQNIPNRWIERAGSIPWLPTSSNFTSRDFFSRGHLKTFVFGWHRRTIEKL